MRIKKIFFLFGIIAGMIGSCDQTDNKFDLKLKDHPMEIGTTWKYNQQVLVKTFDDENSSSITKIDTFNQDFFVWIEKDTILNDTMNVKAFNTSVDISAPASIQYKFLDHEGLKTYAYANPGYNIQKKGSIPTPYLDFLNFPMNPTRKSLQSEIYFQQKPTLDIKYPLQKYDTWIYRYPRENFPLQINKKVIGAENLKINGETYPCYKIRREYLNDPVFDGIIITEWISEIGIVKSMTVQERITLTTAMGEPLYGKNVQITTTLTLDSFGIIE